MAVDIPPAGYFRTAADALNAARALRPPLAPRAQVWAAR